MKKIIFTALISASFVSIAGTNQIIVNSTDDTINEFSGSCTLREALRNANLNQSSPVAGECEMGSATLTDVIVLSSGQTYDLTLPNSAVNPDETGDLDISQVEVIATALRIETSGAAQATIRQTVNGQRVLENHAEGIELHNLIITGGSIDGVGGGVLNDEGFLEITSSNVLSNAANAGGGIYNDSGIVRIVNSEVQLNNATFIGGGGVFNTGLASGVEVDNSLLRGNTGPAGGGIYSNDGIIVVESQSMVNLNQALTGNGGAIANLADSQLIVRDASFEGNTAVGDGGAIHTESSIDTLIEDTSFVNHNATQGGAIRSIGQDLELNRTTFLLNSAASDGGAISASFVTLTQSHLEGNEAFLGNGGAVHATIGGKIYDKSMVRGNTATNGGGLYVQVLELIGSKVENNTATNNGGGVYITNRALVEQAHITENTAAGNGGGIYLRENSIFVSEFQRMLVAENLANAQGGGLWLGSDATIGNATVTLNSSAAGGGLYIEEDAAVSAINMSLIGHLSGQDLYKFGSLSLQNSIISTPGQPDCVMGLSNPTINSLGNNIADDASCFGLNMPTDMNSTNPLLEPLADNGGKTLTYAPAAGSPAINGGDDDACTADPVFGIDQREAARSLNGSCDIGAHELGSPSPIIFSNGFE